MEFLFTNHQGLNWVIKHFIFGIYIVSRIQVPHRDCYGAEL